MDSIRLATEADCKCIWAIFKEVVMEGDSYTFPPDITEEEALSIWMNEDNAVYVAENSGSIVGTYILRANFPGAGSHVSNASFMVSKQARGLGLGKKMALHAMDEALNQGFLAMQFNLVVSTNTGAVKLWKKLGFEIVGTIPEGFRHPKLGLVDAYVMFKKL